MEITPKAQFATGSDCHVAGLLLAAGASKRAGTLNKLLYSKKHAGLNTNMVTNSAQTLLDTGIQTVVAVTSESNNKIAKLLQTLGYDVVDNPDSQQGMGTSLKLGLSHLHFAEAVLVCLADMPEIHPSTLVSILNCWQQSSRDKYIVPTYRGTRGNPVVIPNCFFSDFAEHIGDVGARVVMQRKPTHVVICEVDDPAILIDYDTLEQLETAGWAAPSEVL